MSIQFSVYDFLGYLSSGFILLAAIDISICGASLITMEASFFQIILLTLTAYLFGHVVSHFSSLILEETFIKKCLGPPELILLGSPSESRWRFIFPGYFSPIPEETRDRILNKAKVAGFQVPGTALFFHCFSIVIKMPEIRQRLDSFIALYGFSRNITMSIVISLVVLSLSFLIKNNVMARNLVAGLIIIGMVIACIMFYRYLKFYRLYSLEVFRSYSEISERE